MTATTAQVMGSTTGIRLAIYPMGTPEQGRAEFGPGLADAKAFVLYTACTECGEDAQDAQACADCGEPACGCVSDPHDPDVRRCADCRDRYVCLCRECDPPDPYDY